MARVLGQHELLIRLASGGAANVFLTRDLRAPAPGRLLALKVLLPQLGENDDFLRMFFTEAKIASKLHHPNVVQIAGFGQVDGIHCLAMEYVFGASLAQVLRASARARRPLTVGVLLRITAQVCDALHYAHELREDSGQPMAVVHRDVTPQNILIGFNGVTKLTDFGIAKATDRGWETQAGIVKGKFSYMSPEQAMGKKVDRRTDIFCTGIVLWEALTGRELFKGTTPLEVIENIRKQTIVPPSKVVPGLSPIVDPIVMRALRRSPRQRYQTAGDMRDDIEKLIERAGVQIDAKTISQEFADIFGDIIYKRAFALRAAMAGNADLDELAEVLGGGKLRDDHIPVIPGGVNDPDPLGLFSEQSPIESQSFLDAEAEGLAAMPARSEERFDEVEIDFDAEAAAPEPTAEEEMHFEVDDSDADATAEAQNIVAYVDSAQQGWDDSTRMMVEDDELLSMLSEEDATIGLVPEEWRARFGGSPEEVPPSATQGPIPNSSFGDDEETIDASALNDDFGVGYEATIADDGVEPTLSDDSMSPFIQADARQVQARVVRDELGDRPQTASSHRPVPRAPSLDLGPEDITPAPELEIQPLAPAAHRRTAPPPPPPSTGLIPEPRALSHSIDDTNDPPVMPGELEAPPEENEKPKRPRTPPKKSQPYSSVPAQPAAPAARQVAEQAGKAALDGSRSPSLSASALRELAADSMPHQPGRPPTSPSNPQMPNPYGYPPGSNPGMYPPPGSNPGMYPPGYMQGSHPGYMHGAGTPQSHHGVVIQQNTPSRLRPVIFAILAVVLVAAGVAIGVVLMQTFLEKPHRRGPPPAQTQDSPPADEAPGAVPSPQPAAEPAP